MGVVFSFWQCFPVLLHLVADVVWVEVWQDCMPCPNEGFCAGGDVDPVALSGYYRVGRDQFLVCTPPESCPGFVDDIINKTQCAVGYTSTPCSKCADVRCSICCGVHGCVWYHLFSGFVLPQNYYRLGQRCVKCPNTAWVFIMLFCVAVMIGMSLAVWLNNRRINLAALGIGVDFAQVLCGKHFVCALHNQLERGCTRCCVVSLLVVVGVCNVCVSCICVATRAQRTLHQYFAVQLQPANTGSRGP
jgi:hypothetical protein